MAKALENKTEELHKFADQQTVTKILEEKYMLLFNKTLQNLSRREKNVIHQQLREISIYFNTLALVGQKNKYAPDHSDFFLNFLGEEH